MDRSLTKYAKNNIKEIHALSKRYNGKKNDHAKALIKLVKKHAKEIEELYSKKDKHFTTEVGDLLILCHELLLENRQDQDRIMDLCYGRYRKKIGELLNNRKRKR